VVTMSTENPAKALGAEGRLGSLAVGRQGDISVLERRDGDWGGEGGGGGGQAAISALELRDGGGVVKDVVGASLRVSKAFVPFVTVKGGRVFTPDWGPPPCGWGPERG